MPLHEYACRNCGAESELLIRSAGEQPACPACGSRALTRKLSTFAPRSAAPSPPSCAGGACSASSAGASGGCAGGACPWSG